jgi:hypothetical protein
MRKKEVAGHGPVNLCGKRACKGRVRRKALMNKGLRPDVPVDRHRVCLDRSEEKP